MDYLWQQRHSSSDLLGTVINVHNGDWIRRGKLLTAQQVLMEYQIFRILVLYWICHLEGCLFFYWMFIFFVSTCISNFSLQWLHVCVFCHLGIMELLFFVNRGRGWCWYRLILWICIEGLHLTGRWKILVQIW